VQEANNMFGVKGNPIIESILGDMREEFEQIDIIVLTTQVQMIVATNNDTEEIKEAIKDHNIKKLKKLSTHGIFILTETINKREKEILFKKGNKVLKASDYNSSMASVNQEDYEFGLYNKTNKKTKMEEKVSIKKQTMWDTLGVQKEYFDFMDDIIKNSKDNKVGLSETMKKVILYVRDSELGDGSSTGNKISQYELKLFLAGKVFEEKIKKFT
jgi:hypothetical protein